MATDEPDNERRQVEEIVRWFRERGIDLWFDRVGDSWYAPMMQTDQMIGSADFGVGATRLGAAQDTKARFSAKGADVTIQAPAGEAGADAPMTTVSATAVMPYEALAGVSSSAKMPYEVEERLQRLATEFGWRIGFTRETDGSFLWFASAQDGERLQHGRADSWDDARLAVIENLYPPSSEKVA